MATMATMLRGVMAAASSASRQAVVVQKAGLHCTALCAAGQQARFRKGQGRSGNEHGPLTDSPDWSYADGDQRPAPMTAAQQRRLRKQQRNQVRISELLKEISVASTQDKSPSS